MIAGVHVVAGYEILATANLFVINFADTAESWKVSKLVSLVKEQIRSVRDIELIMNLEEIKQLNDSMMKSIWQIARTLQMQGISAKCVLPNELEIPALDLFAVNGMLELFSSVDEIIYEDDPQETWSTETAIETIAW